MAKKSQKQLKKQFAVKTRQAKRALDSWIREIRKSTIYSKEARRKKARFTKLSRELLSLERRLKR